MPINAAATLDVATALPPLGEGGMATYTGWQWLVVVEWASVLHRWCDNIVGKKVSSG